MKVKAVKVNRAHYFLTDPRTFKLKQLDVLCCCLKILFCLNFKADGVQDVLEDNLGISPTTAIIMLMAFSVWNGLMFIIVMFYILKSTNWLQRMDFTLHGQKHKIHVITNYVFFLL